MSHTLTTMKGAAQEAALMDIQSKADRARRLQSAIIREEAEEDGDQLARLGVVSRKAGLIPSGVFEDGQRNARQHRQLAEVHTLLDDILALAHDACGGGHD